MTSNIKRNPSLTLDRPTLAGDQEFQRRKPLRDVCACQVLARFKRFGQALSYCLQHPHSFIIEGGEGWDVCSYR